MSTWYEVRDIADIEISENELSLEVFVGYDYAGSRYIKIPIELIKKVMEIYDIRSQD